jgi:myosin-crossreactive antigen
MPVYFRNNKYENFLEVFNPNKALELPNFSSIKYFINIDNTVLYKSLYNLLEI